MASTSCS